MYKTNPQSPLFDIGEIASTAIDNYQKFAYMQYLQMRLSDMQYILLQLNEIKNPDTYVLSLIAEYELKYRGLMSQLGSYNTSSC